MKEESNKTGEVCGGFNSQFSVIEKVFSFLFCFSFFFFNSSIWKALSRQPSR